MSEAEALLEIAKAINKLTSEVGFIGIVLLLMAIFKKMG